MFSVCGRFEPNKGRIARDEYTAKQDGQTAEMDVQTGSDPKITVYFRNLRSYATLHGGEYYEIT